MTSTVTNSHQNRIDVASVLARAESLQPLIREHAARGERERRLPEESLKALIDAGVFRLGQPRRYGGAQADIRSTIEASAIERKVMYSSIKMMKNTSGMSTFRRSRART